LSSRLTRLLQNLRAALFESVSESQVGRSVLEEVQNAGLSVYLVVDNPESGEEPEALRLIPNVVEDGERSADFRIDKADLVILRSLGIDPTRTLRRGRRARRK
jgi:hypothetical protein